METTIIRIKNRRSVGSPQIAGCLLGAIGLALTIASVSGQTKSSGKPIVVRASGFAESLSVYQLPPAMAGGALGASKEINEENREIIRHVNPKVTSSADKVVSSNQAKKVRPGAATPQALPTPAVSFEGTSEADTVGVGEGFLPPDTNGAVGPNHYVQTVNVTFRVWDKTGNPLTNTATLSSLFAPLGGQCASANDGDPVVLYDQLADRWIISQFCTVANPNDHQLIAVSETGDPTGSYYLYDFMMPNNKFNDYPKLSVWPDAYYMTDNQFNQAGTIFEQSGVFAFDRVKMLAGDPTASYVYFDTGVLYPPSTGNTGPDGIGGMLPACLDGFTPPPVGAPCPFAYFEAGEFGDPGDQLRIFDFHVDFTTSANSTFNEETGSPLPVAAFDPVTVPNSRNVIPEPSVSSGSYLDAIGDRLMFRLAYRNLGTSETLILNHTVNAATHPAYRAGVRFYELTRTSPSAPFTIAEQQTWAGAPGDTVQRWMGSGAMNFQGDVAVGYSVSSSTVFPSIRYAAKLYTDPAGSGLAQGEQTIIDGSGSQTHTSGRWGDYSDMTVDPSDDCSFWYTQEYYPASGVATWHTRIVKIVPGTLAVSPRGTISGTVTNCSSGLPISNATVQITGGYSRMTDANGTYSATVVPGTYTATVSWPNYGTVTSGNLFVSNGGTATFNACLTGMPLLAAAPPAVVTSESYAPANNAVDPGETVTVSLPLSNNGTSDTNNLIATLMATGGVTSPGDPQNYGVIPASGGSAARAFTFTASGSCGATITLTLQLQDGAINLGMVTFTMELGAPGGPAQVDAQNFDGVVAPALPGDWTSAHTVGPVNFVTSTTASDSSPNDAYAPDNTATGTVDLVSATFQPAQTLTFRNLFNLEVQNSTTGYDGMVLEISFDGGASFTDIVTAGASFATGGYNRTISSSYSNPLGGRQAWSGLSAGSTGSPAYITTTVNLPSQAATQSFKLRWRVGTDSSKAASGVSGVRIDSITTSAPTFICANGSPAILNGPPPSPVIVGSPYSFTFIAGGNPTPIFGLTGGPLPPGLSLSPDGVLSGTATSGGAGLFPNIIVTATNGTSPDAMQTFSLTTATHADNYIASFGLTGGDAALNYDYDHDGLSNLMEYALGLDPTVASLTGLPVVTLKDYGGTKYLSMTFYRSSLAIDLTYTVQASSDLLAWTDVGTSIHGAPTTGPGFLNETGVAPNFTVEVRDIVPFDPNSPGQTRFMRLKVSSP